MAERKEDDVREVVRRSYAEVAKGQGNCCGEGWQPKDGDSCCEPQLISPVESVKFGYTADELKNLPEGADLGLSCGNPQAIAALKPGEVVLDLGSGGGFDCFIAAPKVGEDGKVIGVDMTPEMIKLSRENAEKGGYTNIEFRLGEIEHLPVGDNSVDVILSNCVINLSPDKKSVYRDAFRVLKSGGRVSISDVVATEEMPEEVLNDERLLCGCISGALKEDDLRAIMESAGFVEIIIGLKESSREQIRNWAPGSGVEKYVVSADISAKKPQT